MIRTENQIYADLISVLNSALNYFNIEGWKVCRLVQPSKFTETEPAVYVSVEQTSRRGAQYSRDKTEDGALVHTELYREEIYVNISALRRSLIEDDGSTLSANDVLKIISSWLVSSEGLAKIKRLGYAIYCPSEIKQVSFKTDSENKTLMPSFSIIFITEQSWNSSIEEISEYKLKTKGI